METSAAEVWGAEVVNLTNLSHLTPEIPSCPILVKLFLKDNRTLTDIPPSFFINMPVLQILDLSHTSIQSLPPSISNLIYLQEFILRECPLLIELAPEIGALKSLKLFDLEGTEIMYLPKEIGKLKNLEYLRVSLSLYADDYIERKGIETVIPRRTVSKLKKLKELSIGVNPEAEWWEIEVTETILEDLRVLPDLETLKLYLPTAKAVKRFLQLQSFRVPIYTSLLNFRLIIGYTEQVACTLPPQVEKNFTKLPKCLKYVNGDGIMGEVEELIKNTRALFLCRHWTIEKLSIFDVDKLKYCLLMECNEMKTLVNGKDLDKKYEYKGINFDKHKQAALGSLEYLGIYFMKKLQRIWIGIIDKDCLSRLTVLALHTCPELTTVFTGSMLDNLQSLTELVVEDCPKVSSLVSLESTPWSFGPFLPNLRRILLLDLPELVSISSNLFIAPELDCLLVFNCMKLEYLSDMELPRDVKEIKGEIEWWNALKCDKSIWSSVFVELKRDGNLMSQLAEDTNSIQQFLQLQMTSPRPALGSSLPRKASEGWYSELTREYLQLLDKVKVPFSSEETQELLTNSTITSDDEGSIVTECSMNDESTEGKSHYEGMEVKSFEIPVLKVRKQKLGDRISALQELVSPFGKTDTASVLLEAIGYIKFLHHQISALSAPYTKKEAPTRQQQWTPDKSRGQRQDLRSQGLCLVPISSTRKILQIN